MGKLVHPTEQRQRPRSVLSAVAMIVSSLPWMIAYLPRQELPDHSSPPSWVFFREHKRLGGHVVDQAKSWIASLLSALGLRRASG